METLKFNSLRSLITFHLVNAQRYPAFYKHQHLFYLMRWEFSAWRPGSITENVYPESMMPISTHSLWFLQERSGRGEKQIWETEKLPCWAVKETATPSHPPRKRWMRGVKLQLWTRTLQLQTADTQSRRWAQSGITSPPQWPNRVQKPRTPVPSYLTPSAGRCTAHPAQAGTLPLSTWAPYCRLPVSRLPPPAVRISVPLTSSGRAPGASIRTTTPQGPASTT